VTRRMNWLFDTHAAIAAAALKAAEASEAFERCMLDPRLEADQASEIAAKTTTQVRNIESMESFVLLYGSLEVQNAFSSLRHQLDLARRTNRLEMRAAETGGWSGLMESEMNYYGELSTKLDEMANAISRVVRKELEWSEPTLGWPLSISVGRRGRTRTLTSKTGKGREK
jgi:hypothetical protein